ncbi:transglycosylase domain-containing protein [Paraburkholderia caballeronis]|uniref:transglycosylase domain-containing protein n=1 Tax=Paraburkholderia caballeronis TaxID=416943 RepID=UPI001066BCE7|nr:transglycosylase domain-containing protein [Paraburkholderia caballeronis]TDV14996.1 transglycosylase [Paraburkholderia caballeronis]TDV16880.1 transglycosylase [Paraburkholderia caballeronis]TDV25732.1 transglycosylase [Paraburkholderia caballeronis]
MNRPSVRFPLRAAGFGSLWKWVKWGFVVAVLVALVITARIVQIEIETSRLQAHYLSELTRDIGFTVGSGPSLNIRFPSSNGPYDVRLGYAQLPTFVARLNARGFAVAAQARDSERMISLADDGLFLPYAEKDQAGLMLRDAGGATLFHSRYPQRAYENFDAVPPLVRDSLLFIEDRYLLADDQPNRNPALDWGRFGHALADQGLRLVNRGQATPGGSTLATQIEKFRHSPGGRTATPPEKLRQIASASVRAYLDGPQTMPARQQILVRYLNSVPLAAKPGVGEISGIGDGLAAWYGRDFRDVNRVLRAPLTDATLAEQALAFRQVLSLLIAQRAPSYYLQRDNPELARLTDSYLRLLASGGVITPALRDAALAAQLTLDRSKPVRAPVSYVERKATTSLRTQLMSALGVRTLYDLDRLDLSATATLDDSVQQAVSDRLADAMTKDGARAAGLVGFEMLRPQDDPSKISYSFTLFERRNGENVVRVQTDSVNQPFDINQGARLNLGSTAKLRTVITYLQIVQRLHAQYAPLDAKALRAVQPDRSDVLTRWAVDYLSHTQDRSLRAMLEAAVDRKYSANPGETFYTGGGAQSFNNFESSDNEQILPLRRAFQHSVNLVFVRLMRDIVRYEMIQTSGPPSQWLDDPAVRHAYLTRFADGESQVYMNRFYARYQGKRADDALATLLRHVRKSPPKLATALRSVAPDGSLAWFDTQMRAQLKGTKFQWLTDDDFAKLYDKYAIDRFNLNDRGYIASVHPLELWLLNYLRAHPGATLAQVQQDSGDVRLYTYKWLFRTRYHATQDRRIRHMIELRAYDAIGKSWRELGYPFATLTPSYGTAIGASGDRPAALAQLIGLVAADGDKLPTHSIDSLEFARGTPYETRFVHAAVPPQPLVAPEITVVVRELLTSVVQGGTAKRLADGLTFPDGRALPVYGKTGTGDQRFNVYAPGARLIESRKVNRSATFVFVIGDRFYGTLTAWAHEPYAARYTFTSAMSVQLLKSLAPVLQPLLEEPAASGGSKAAKTGVRQMTDAPTVIDALRRVAWRADLDAQRR